MHFSSYSDPIIIATTVATLMMGNFLLFRKNLQRSADKLLWIKSLYKAFSTSRCLIFSPEAKAKCLE